MNETTDYTDDTDENSFRTNPWKSVSSVVNEISSL
jgi:hypothetical protein